MYEGKTKLSKGLLGMKFMKKTKERVDKEEEDAEGQAMYSNEITEEMRKSGKAVFLEASILRCKNLMECGRVSFGGMNPEVERSMLQYYTNEVVKLENLKQEDTEIDDREMVEAYCSLNDTIANKFLSNRKKK